MCFVTYKKHHCVASSCDTTACAPTGLPDFPRRVDVLDSKFLGPLLQRLPKMVRDEWYNMITIW